MKKGYVFITVVCLFISTFSVADIFGTGSNQFEIEFVTISGDASGANGTNKDIVFKINSMGGAHPTFWIENGRGGREG